MDPKDKIEDVDLPAPEARVLTPTEKARRTWRLLTAFVVFVAAYSVLHKLLLPAALKLTSLKNSPYAKIDLWFFLPVVIAYRAITKGRVSLSLSFLGGVSVVYGVWELFLISDGVYAGWLAISRLLSSIPLAAVMIVFLTKARGAIFNRAAWLGAIMMVVYCSWEAMQGPKEFHPNKKVATAIAEPDLSVSESSPCGAPSVSIKEKVETAYEIQIQPCGFSPSSLRVPEKETLIVRNATQRPVNLRALFFREGKQRTGWNRWVPSQSQIAIPVPSQQVSEMSLLFSDNAPELGLVALVPKANRDSWILTRSPLQIVRKP